MKLTTAQTILCRLPSLCTYVTSGRRCWCVMAYLLYECRVIFKQHISCNSNSFGLPKKAKHTAPHITSFVDAVQFVHSSDREEPVASLGAHRQRPTITTHTHSRTQHCYNKNSLAVITVFNYSDLKRKTDPETQTQLQLKSKIIPRNLFFPPVCLVTLDQIRGWIWKKNKKKKQ